MRRLRAAEWMAGAAGLALLGSLFLRWYGGRGADGSAWQAFSVLDVVLALLALVPLALVVLHATRASPSVPVFFSVLTTVAGALAAVLVLYRIANQPGANDLIEVRAGAWVGLAAAAATGVAGWRSVRVERIPNLPLPPIQEMPVPAP